MIKQITLCIVIFVCSFACTLHGQLVIGPGDVESTVNDTAFPFLIVDKVASQVLLAGDYQAMTFDYEFSLSTISGTITPILVTGDDGDFTPIAIGTPIVATGLQSFTSTEFGGEDQFSLTADTQVYAGYLWDNRDSALIVRPSALWMAEPRTCISMAPSTHYNLARLSTCLAALRETLVEPTISASRLLPSQSPARSHFFG